MSGIIKTDGIETSNRGKQGSSYSGVNEINGVFPGTVVDNRDSIYTGRLYVRLDFEGPLSDPRPVQLTTPYGGTTEEDSSVKDSPTQYGVDGTSYNGTVKTYGMWQQAPVVGTPVLVAFYSGSSVGFYIGSLIKKDRNHMMGGRASGLNQNGQVTPVGEKNPYDGENPDARPQDNRSLAILKEQGLDQDFSRGHSMSSARRETPSNVFGITTLHGHTFTMDDGATDGSRDSRNIRMRSRDGAQILIDDTNKMIFINNHKGNAWVEIDENGKIDVYSKSTISMHCEEDFNIHTKADFNVQADGAINMTARGSEGVKIDAATGDMDLYANKNFQQQAGIDGHVRCGGRYYETAKRIDMNGPVAELATRVQLHGQPANTNILASAATRVPEHHPWKGASTIQEKFKTDQGKAS